MCVFFGEGWFRKDTGTGLPEESRMMLSQEGGLSSLAVIEGKLSHPSNTSSEALL